MTGIVVEVKFFCELCKKRYNDYRTQDQLKGKAMRFARNRGAHFFPDSGVIAYPHEECVKSEAKRMIMNGQGAQVEKIANSLGFTFEEYLEKLGI